MPDPIVRILSDLHFRDRGSRLQDPDALLPLMQGVEHLVINGDALEARHPNSVGLLLELRQFFARLNAQITWVAGNHDPEISAHQEVQLAGGALWATHGDIFWESAAPWSRQAAYVRRLVREERIKRRMDPDRSEIEELFSAHRAAHIRVGAHHDPTDHSPRGKLKHLFTALFPPTQVWSMLRCWQSSPRLAARWAQKHRPRARFVVYGHTHFPRCWQFRDLGITVINTGSFTKPFGALCVDVAGERVLVRRVVENAGGFEAGPIWREFPLPARLHAQAA